MIVAKWLVCVSAVCERKEGVNCDNGLCLLQYQICDGVVDCNDFSDELRCRAYPIN